MANALIAVALVLVLLVGEWHGYHRGKRNAVLRIGRAMAAGKYTGGVK